MQVQTTASEPEASTSTQLPGVASPPRRLFPASGLEEGGVDGEGAGSNGPGLQLAPAWTAEQAAFDDALQLKTLPGKAGPSPAAGEVILVGTPLCRRTAPPHPQAPKPPKSPML